MPSSELIMERNGNLEMELGLGMGRMLDDEQRALQTALDQLTMLGLGEGQEDNNNNSSSSSTRDTYLAALYDGEPKKKSSNTTECVPVPSSEHVAEIVGRQGCKIKALRAKTNTYIKTPVRGEEPVFVVTGRREDVAMARREIISAAEHFSLIRASRNKDGVANGTVPVPPNLPGQTTIQVRVPYRVVGLVVGPKGATIKRIQQQTHTYIVTPSRDKEPVFEVTGMPANVDRAREEIEAHIAMRTGGIVDLNDENDFHCNGMDAAFGARQQQQKSWAKPALLPRKPLANFRNNGGNSLAGGCPEYFYGGKMAEHHGPFNNGVVYGEPFSGFAVDARELTAAGGGAEPGDHLWTHPDLSGSAPQRRSSTTGGGVCPIAPHLSPTVQDNGVAVHSIARRVHSDPLQGNPRVGSANAGGGSPLPAGQGGVRHLGTRDCQVCFESEVTAALVPCGHNLFCMECANRICQRSNAYCPICLATVTQAIRIFS